MLFNLSEQNSIANHFVSELRDVNIQSDRLRFRKNVERLGQIMAYEISKKFKYKDKAVKTPLGSSNISLMEDGPVLITVMRAGLPYFQGFLDFFDKCDCGFIGAYRKEDGHDDVVINLEYMATPLVENREVILIDPMLATGHSFVRSIDALIKRGIPSHIYIASLVSVHDGISYVSKNVKTPHSVWTCAVDEKLNELFYIVPGLGDAGDLCFGPKL
jgi:uracil phosphoribosyltransferase